jgi:hypothetical protein
MAHYDCSRCGTALGISPEHCPTCLESSSVEHTGGSSSYYRVSITSPTTLTEPYDAECNDIIEALGMTFAEGNVFKALWRTAASRQGKHKKGNNGVYDAEKMVFFSNRILSKEQTNG